jgi:hypothetical protein
MQQPSSRWKEDPWQYRLCLSGILAVNYNADNARSLFLLLRWSLPMSALCGRFPCIYPRKISILSSDRFVKCFILVIILIAFHCKRETLSLLVSRNILHEMRVRTVHNELAECGKKPLCQNLTAAWFSGKSVRCHRSPSHYSHMPWFNILYIYT